MSKINKKKAALHNLGCKVNAYETEAMQQLLEEAGYEIVDFSEQADVYVINTCSVTNMADRKSRQMLHRAQTKNPDSIVIACLLYTYSQQRIKKRGWSAILLKFYEILCDYTRYGFNASRISSSLASA